MKPRLTRSQKAAIFGGINLIVVLLVVLQLWLLTATMNAWMGGDTTIVWPAAVASLACLAFNLWLLRRVLFLEGRKPESKNEKRHGTGAASESRP
jgi:hypothetical protein